MEESLTSLYRIIQRHQKLYQKESKDDFYPKFRNSFEELCKNVSKLSDFVDIKTFERILSGSKDIPLTFVGHQEGLINFLNIVKNLKQLNFNSYDIFKMVKILAKYLKNDREHKKFEALMQLLEHLIII
ncbi:MAG: hypothetical protein ACTSRG_15615 [Candidatus Helarchaeota archaeon]